MAKKLIGFYCGSCFYNHDWDECTMETTGLGGTETWIIEVAKRLEKDYHVIMFNDCSMVHNGDSGITYIPLSYFKTLVSGFNFEHFILMQCINDDIDLIHSKNIYYMPSCEDITYGINRDVLRLDKIKRVGYLSEWHKSFLIERYGLTEDVFFKHGYGINEKTYRNVNFIEKENAMVWSSQNKRGLKFFIDRIMPLITKEVPDFKLYVCSYLENNDINTNSNVYTLGKKNKHELSELQKKSKIWVYPNYGLDADMYFFHETFCITAVENAMAQNAIVCLGGKDGLYTTLEGYSGLIDGSFFNEYDIIYEENFNEVATKLANEAIHLLKDDSYRISKVKELLDICKVHTWDNSYKQLLEEFKRNEEYE